MNLILDKGNSVVKLAVFQGETLIESFTSDEDSLETTIQHLTTQYDAICQGLISSVSENNPQILDYFPGHCKARLLSHDFNFPFENLYQTPKSLGLDRMALVAGALKHYPQNNVLIIDAGTCITYDFVDAQNRYHGGAISPGLRMRYKALHAQTAKLPLLAPSKLTSMIGNTTATSIHTGIISGMIHEIEGTVSSYRSKFPELTVVLTGGDGDFLFKQLKISIFAVSNLLLEGLNQILELNSEK